jgi:glutamine synthetase
MDSREAKWGPSINSNEKTGAYVPTPHDTMYSARTQISETLEDNFGVYVDSHKHGKAPTAQQTFELAARGLKSAGDAINTLKFITKNLAMAVNASATFMPYPIEGECGNSLYISASLWKTSEQNILYETKESYGQLSQAGRYFVGGLLEHAPTICLFASPIPNSYRKLAVDNLTYGWSAIDPHAMVFVPSYKKNIKESKRVVYKAADPSANPYLAQSLIIAAGLDGIKKKIEPGDPTEEAEGKKKRVERALPTSLYEATKALESDTAFIKGIVPSELLGDYLELKLKQHKESLTGITGLELRNYFTV